MCCFFFVSVNNITCMCSLRYNYKIILCCYVTVLFIYIYILNIFLYNSLKRCSGGALNSVTLPGFDRLSDRLFGSFFSTKFLLSTLQVFRHV